MLTHKHFQGRSVAIAPLIWNMKEERSAQKGHLRGCKKKWKKYIHYLGCTLVQYWTHAGISSTTHTEQTAGVTTGHLGRGSLQHSARRMGNQRMFVLQWCNCISTSACLLYLEQIQAKVCQQHRRFFRLWLTSCQQNNGSGGVNVCILWSRARIQ